MPDTKEINEITKDKNQGDVGSRELRNELHRLQEDFHVDEKKLREISEHFQEELEEGLQDHGKNIAMYVTWVLGFPTGKEEGSFLTVDLGGTNIRVCYVSLQGSHKDIGIKQHQYKLPENIKTAEASELWTFVAESLQKFIEEQNLRGSKESPLCLGFTFSYPAIQGCIDHGVLQTWTKGFNISGVEGKDVASQLRSTISKLDLPIELIAVINDTTGAMIASAYKDPATIIGAIFGTGCNAAYMDKISNIRKLKDSKAVKNLSPDTPMAINCEYGAFDNARRVLPLTKYDKQIDEESPRPGEQAFEKMSAGLYLGEIYRLIILDLHSRGVAFKEQNIGKLRDPYCIDTAFLSKIEDDDSPDLHESAQTFRQNFDVEMTRDELRFSKHVAKVIAIRGARLCATGVAAICRKQGINKGHVAADGSVANKHPKFKKRWARALGDILGWEKGVADGEDAPIVIISAADGSGVGAAVISAMAMERESRGEKARIKER